MCYINFVIKSENGDHGWQHSQARLLIPWLAPGRRIENRLFDLFPPWEWYRHEEKLVEKMKIQILNVHLWPKILKQLNLVSNIIDLDVNSQALFTTSDKILQEKSKVSSCITLFYGKHRYLDLGKKIIHILNILSNIF